MYLIKKLSITSLLLVSLYGCTDKHEPANCPPDCPDGMKSSSIEETDQLMKGQWQVFLRQISEDQATEMQGTVTIDKKLSPGLYSGFIEGEGRFIMLGMQNWDCSQPNLPDIISCSERESRQRLNWKVTLGMSTDGIELDLDGMSIFMDVHQGYFGRSIGTKFYTGEETYLMGKIVDGKSTLEAMELRVIKVE